MELIILYLYLMINSIYFPIINLLKFGTDYKKFNSSKSILKGAKLFLEYFRQAKMNLELI